MSEGLLKYTSKAAAERMHRWRTLKDIAARYGVTAGGLSVIVAILLIFFYLLYVVFPLFLSADTQVTATYDIPEPEQGATVYLAMEEQNELAARLTDQGRVVFFKTETGAPVDSYQLSLPEDVDVLSVTSAAAVGVVAYGLSNGQAMILKINYKVSYPNDVRVLTPEIQYPMGEDPILVDEDESPIMQLALQSSEDETTIVAKTADDRLIISHFLKEESMLTDEVTLERTQTTLELPIENIDKLLLDKEQRNFYLANSQGQLAHFDVSDKQDPNLVQQIQVVKKGDQLTNLTFLTGDISLLVGDSNGQISQWTPVKDISNKPVLTKIRSFEDQSTPIKFIAAERNRKGFLALDEGGNMAIYHSTAERLLIEEKISDAGLERAALSPRANAVLIQTSEQKIHFLAIHNEHPEVSWSSLWGKVWYESYPEEAHIWQSSSASNDFEPKFSLTPLVFGTLKAAFYAMIFAIPIAIMGAIYTAYFMAPRMRRLVKPSIEIMEALPTVILGFLAGLWLAPLVESNLPGIFSLLLLMPVGVLLFAYAWQHAPQKVRHAIPEGWDAAVLLPVILIIGWGCLALSAPMESLLFDGDMRSWMKTKLDVDFDQRNSIIVGLAMGFAVIPTIFSIAEDAIFSVPKHLTYGSLALGATPWQTMVRVVLLTASPGIFSAVMIGLGRAVGETMIVLMATGNTPVMDFSIFQGMRTLSANIAVEMPESEVDSTHYRVLFLAALVLFLFTFVFNTAAEIIRQRLRQKYSSL